MKCDISEVSNSSKRIPLVDREKDICKIVTATEPELIIFWLLIQVTVNDYNMYTSLIETCLLSNVL